MIPYLNYFFKSYYSKDWIRAQCIFIVLICSILPISKCFSQNIIWTNSFNVSNGKNDGKTIHVNNNLLVFSGNSLDTFTSTNDIVLIGMDLNGNWNWTYTKGALLDDDYLSKSLMTQSGDIIYTGILNGWGLNPVPVLCKVDFSGNEVWLDTIIFVPNDFTLDGADNILSTNSGINLSVSKIDHNTGNIIQSVIVDSLNPASDYLPTKIFYNQDGTVYLTGAQKINNDFDLFVYKLDSNLNVLNYALFPVLTNNNDFIDVCVDTNLNIYIASKLTGGPTLSYNYSKIDSGLNLQWIKTVTNQNAFQVISSADDSGFYISGVSNLVWTLSRFSNSDGSLEWQQLLDTLPPGNSKISITETNDYKVGVICTKKSAIPNYSDLQFFEFDATGVVLDTMQFNNVNNKADYPKNIVAFSGSYYILESAMTANNKTDYLVMRYGAQTGLSELTTPPTEIILYPSPSSDFIELKTNEQIESIDIYSVEGRMIKSILQPEIKSKKLNIAFLSTGFYIIEVQLKNQFFCLKFLRK